MPETRSAKEHSYTKEPKNKGTPATPRPSQNKGPHEILISPSLNVLCYICNENLDKSYTLNCNLCENYYCRSCLKIETAVFGGIQSMPGLTWFCNKCQSVPGVHKMLVRIGNVEERQDQLEERVNKIEKDQMTSESVKEILHSELDEIKEIEGRKLNIMCFNIPESKQEDIQCRQAEDKDFLVKLFETKLDHPVAPIEIIKPVRLGARKDSNGTLKCRPLRFTVGTLEMKRQLIKAGMALRKSEDDLFSNIYLTPDLTKKQREESFKLREQKRYRMNELNETGLTIRHGRIVKVSDNKGNSTVASTAEGLAEGPAVGSM